MTVALIGHITAASEAERQVFAFLAFFFPLPVKEMVGLLEVFGNTLPDIADFILFVTYPANAFIEAAVVMNGKDIIHLNATGLRAEFSDGIAPL
jgi:hypothetical protein